MEMTMIKDYFVNLEQIAVMQKLTETVVEEGKENVERHYLLIELIGGRSLGIPFESKDERDEAANGIASAVEELL